MEVVFLFPTQMEAAKFTALAPDARVVICGVGMAAAAATLARIVGECSEVILAGIAGSYDISKVALCEVVEVTSERVEELPERFQKEYRSEPRFGLRSVSSNSVNSSNFESAKSDIENMEGAAVMALCESVGVRCSEIRAISNLVGDDYSMWKIEDAIEALTNRLLVIYNECN